MAKQKGYTVIIPEDVARQIEEAPDEVKAEIEALVKAFVEGSKNPAKVGKKMKVEEPVEKLLCGACGSKDIDWSVEVDDDEVYYRCHNCGEHAWMTKGEFEVAKKRHPDLLFT